MKLIILLISALFFLSSCHYYAPTMLVKDKNIDNTEELAALEENDI